MGYKKYLFFCVLLEGCPSPKNQDVTPLAVTQLQGSVSLTHPVADARVCVAPFRDAEAGSIQSVCTRTDVSGNWELEAGALFGDVIITADEGQLTSPLSAVVSNVEQFERSGHIAVTPVTHLAAGYAHYLICKESKPRVAIAKSHGLIYQHFGGLRHDTLAPWYPDAGAADAPPTTDSVWLHVYLSALEELAARYSKAAGLQPRSIITLQSLTAQLFEDIEADGLFDGVGQSGARLKASGIELNGDTLRRDLAVALSRFVEGQHNQTRLAIAEVSPAVQELVTRQTEIFVGSGKAYDETGPVFGGCTVLGEDSLKSILAYPQHGKIKLTCAWNAKGQISDTRLSFADGPSNISIVSQRREENNLIAYIDTEKLSSMLSEPESDSRAYQLSFEATDVFGTKSTAYFFLEVDNRSFSVSNICSPRWVGPGSTYHVAGDTDRPIKQVTVRADNLEAKTVLFAYDDKVSSFDMSYEVPCDKQYLVQLSVEAWSGAKASQYMLMSCDDTAPTITLKNSFFTGDDDQYSVNMAEGPWPMTIRKDYTKLDYLPNQNVTSTTQNLPVIRFRVEDSTISSVGVTSDQVTVKYRYKMGDSLQYTREWEALSPELTGDYELPLSYQTLLPQRILEEQIRVAGLHNFIATCHIEDQHQVDICVTDKAGNERLYVFPFFFDLFAPPLEVTDCKPTDALLGGSLSPPNMSIVYQPSFDLLQAELQIRSDFLPNSLVPSGTVILGLPDRTLETTITSIDMRVARRAPQSLSKERKARASRAVGGQGHDYATSPSNCQGIRIGWEDAPCVELIRANVYPRSWVEETGLASNNFLSSSLQDSESDFDPAVSTHGAVYSINAGRPYTLLTKTGFAAAPFVDRNIDYGNLDYDMRGNPVIVVSQRLGAEVFPNRSDVGPDLIKYIEEVATVRSLKLRVPPLQLSVMGTSNGVPVPKSVEFDASCRAAVSVHFLVGEEYPSVVYE